MAAKRKGVRRYQMKPFAAFTSCYATISFLKFFFSSFSSSSFASIRLTFLFTYSHLDDAIEQKNSYFIFTHQQRKRDALTRLPQNSEIIKVMCTSNHFFFPLTLNLFGRSKFSISSSYGNIKRYERIVYVLFTKHLVI